MTPEQMAALREPFPASAIGKLPRITCKKCSEASGRVCGEHHKGQCAACGNYITERHIHLDYVGHAAVTDRLLKVDPEWTWEPVATDPNTGMPMAANGGLWIRLTVCGVTRYGWGDGPDFKQQISDALRNSAMRFGVALDLWSKQELDDHHDEPPPNVNAATGEVQQPTLDGSEPPPGRACVVCKKQIVGAPVREGQGYRHRDCASTEPF